MRRQTLVMAATLGLAALAPARAEPAKALAPIPPAVVALMKARGTTPSAPLVLRSYKKEGEIEVWKQNAGGRFVFIKTYPICRWSGQLGPKHRSGDRQTPEGFYPIWPKQMNPNSHYYLSFDTGFPNAYDRAHGWSGSAVMVHGTCSSMGCFAMTDKAVGEIYAIARDALKGGQPAFQLQAYPFHMTAKNMALYRDDPNIDFWRQLKEGSDHFESTGEILVVGVKNGRYSFAPSADPAKEAAATAFHAAQLAETDRLVKDGSAAIRTTYADGGQNPLYTALWKAGANLGTVSRPEALALAGIDVTLVPARRHRRPAPEPLMVTRADWVPDPVAQQPAAGASTAPAPTAPEPAAPEPAMVKAHAGAALAAATGGAVLDGRPFGYAVYAPPAVPELIAGAMPMRPPVLAANPVVASPVLANPVVAKPIVAMPAGAGL